MAGTATMVVSRTVSVASTMPRSYREAVTTMFWTASSSESYQEWIPHALVTAAISGSGLRISLPASARAASVSPRSVRLIQ
ncbi:hypothetical protein ADIAG_01560 [Paeniglutamicibacter gangotriensis Lz1y]|uniref:Uncharacterized protein n=1 Tax=Paeniglutamicibacter gangotriensis Lz1y TaxID=1276920 RepID=M7NJV7_9MICC|nr:hypothetical protein ADIAG_01560 [Paeniglutamicibacter gangotriensis Lz1y]